MKNKNNIKMRNRIEKLPCGFKAFKDTIPEKFSIICTPETLSYDSKNWNEDLYNSYVLGDHPGSFFPTRNNGKIELWLSSLEELYEVSKFFNNKGFRTFYGKCIGRFSRDWIYRDQEDISGRAYDIFQLFVHIKSRKQYIKFRDLLIGKELKELRYFTVQEVGKYLGKYTNYPLTSIEVLV